MSRFSLPALACACALSFTLSPACAGDPAPLKAPDSTAALLARLKQPVKIDATGETLLPELCDYLLKKYEVAVVVNEEQLKAIGLAPGEVLLKLPRGDGLSIAAYLNHSLGQRQLTFLVRKGYLEVMPVSIAAAETKNLATGAAVTMREPLVSAVLKNQPFEQAVTELADDFGLTVLVSPAAGDARTAAVSARLLNVPADKAIELLALQADLRVVRRGAAYLITTKGNAAEIFEEELNKKRQKIELEKPREAPARPAEKPLLIPAPPGAIWPYPFTGPLTGGPAAAAPPLTAPAKPKQ
jgi:hypothetical protein